MLVDGDVRVWDSLAIAEYRRDVIPTCGPPMQRDGVTRCACAEVIRVSGAATGCRMNVRRSYPRLRSRRADRDIDRAGKWAEARTRFGVPSARAPYLYGAFSNAGRLLRASRFPVNTHGVQVFTRRC